MIHLRFETFKINKPNYTLLDCIQASRDAFGNNFMPQDQLGFRFSQVIESLMDYYANNVTDPDDTLHFDSMHSTLDVGYIIPVAVQYSPLDWTDVKNTPGNLTGELDSAKKSIFEMLTPEFVTDLQNGKAILLIDQSVEGYGAVWLWKWFHSKCELYGINPSAIMYLTGDQFSADSYAQWCSANTIGDKMAVIPSISLSRYINIFYHRYNLHSDFDEILAHKTANADSLYLYDCTNMRPRPQRVLNYLHLMHNGLIQKGNVSMAKVSDWKPFVNFSNYNFFEKHGLPRNFINTIDVNADEIKANYFSTPATEHYYSFVERILDQMYKNSWVSIITESSYFDYEHSVFISEKTFKPLACMQPFVIVGSKHTLKYLRKLGYKTFAPFIDESYDDMDDGDRIAAVIESIKKIDAIEDKASWYNSMRDILEHNFNVFMKIGREKSTEHMIIQSYYNNYFYDRNKQ